ncbi:hypothetical protein [Hyphomicrobium sp.]|uniref:hypothetical protein n=1 Tax=Hyphomicrobium sp. TaxID=82 RepID=UPI001DB4DAEF|nr:hypothetical protein [Hyphomicrobium sp.]MBY0560003.1 hypothetical protein [Hyphomicrobium sp.]
MATDISFQLEFRNKRFNAASKGLAAFAKELSASWDGSAQVLSSELKDFLQSVAQALADRHSSPWPGGTGKQTLSRRSGNLTASILGSVRVEGTAWANIEGHIAAAFPGVVHEYGATIRPKSAKFLTVPLPAALDGRGVPLKRSARDWQHTFVAKSRAGNLIIFQRRGSSVVPLYVLKTEVKIPPRLGMRTTLDAGIPYFVDRAADQVVKAMLKGASA